MSTLPQKLSIPNDASRLPMTLPRLYEKKSLGEPIVMITAYDYPSALAVDAAGVDLVLVGDSGAMTVLGHLRARVVVGGDHHDRLAERLLLGQRRERHCRALARGSGGYARSRAHASSSATASSTVTMRFSSSTWTTRGS